MHIIPPETDNCPSCISGRERMTVEDISQSTSTKECCLPSRDQTRNLLFTSLMCIQQSHRGWQSGSILVAYIIRSILFEFYIEGLISNLGTYYYSHLMQCQWLPIKFPQRHTTFILISWTPYFLTILVLNFEHIHMTISWKHTYIILTPLNPTFI